MDKILHGLVHFEFDVGDRGCRAEIARFVLTGDAGQLEMLLCAIREVDIVVDILELSDELTALENLSIERALASGS